MVEEDQVGGVSTILPDDVRGTHGKPRPLSVALLHSLRAEQWIKNLFLFAGLMFTLDLGHGAGDWLRASLGFILFCLLSSSVYLLNDIVDAERDRLHPLKRYRPIAAREIDPRFAAGFAAALAALSLLGGFALDRMFGAMAVAYLLLQLAYSFWLKHVVIVDLLAIASGFVLRAAAGAFAVGVDVSPWLLVCTTLLALFLGLAKRRSELTLLQDEAGGHRKILEEYSPEMLDQMITVVMASTLMAYALYTFNSPTAEGHRWLMATIPFVIYGLFRYLYLVHRKNAGGSTAAELIEDRPLILDILLWAIACGVIMLFAH